MNSYNIPKATASIAFCLLAALGLYAENEPTDNTFAGATEIIISGQDTGSLGSGDIDFYKITNTEGFSAIEIHYIFEGSGPDTHRMKVFGPDSTVNQLFNATTSTYQATYTITDGPADATYFISVQKQSADGTLPYTLSVNGSFAEIDLADKSVINTGETYNIELSSGTSWEVTDIPAWVNVSPTSGTNDATLTVEVQPNPFLAREAIINIGGVFHTITQAGNDGSTDNEPTDNNISGATTMLLNSVATGSISNSDTDYYMFVKPAGSSTITVDFAFSGSGPDTHRMRVLGPSSQDELFNATTGSNGDLRYRALYVREDTSAFENSFIVCIEGVSSGGNNSYSLTVTGTSTMIDLATKSVANSSGSYTVVVASNTTWSVTDLPTWATASPESGSGNDSVEITYEANTATTEREATFIIGGQSHVLTQAAADPEPVTTIDQATKSVTTAAGSYTIAVTSNTTWSVTDLPTWATVTPESGSGNGSVEITYEANTATTERVATLIIGGESHVLTQAAAEVEPDPVTTIDQLTKSVTTAAGSYTIAVTSNTTWSVTDLPAWATVTPESGSGNGSVEITYEANTATTERVATLMIGGESHVLTQAAADAGDTPILTPVGWVYFQWPYSYSFDDSTWHFYAPNGTQQRVNLSTGIWGDFDQASGWNYYLWPYGYSHEDSEWYYYNGGENVIQWLINVTPGASAVWSLFGD